MCACEKLTFALSKISGLCGNPELPNYDIHYNEDEVVKQVATLRHERDELRADKERLDWLEKEKCALVCLHDDLRGHKWTAEFEKQEWTECETARAALDSARAKQGEAP